MKKFLICLLVICFSTLSYGGTIDPKNSDKDYLEYGAKHKCVLKLIGQRKDAENSPYIASCVAISPLYMVTAAHVIDGAMTHGVVYNNEVYGCAIVATHINFSPNVFGKYDIALIRLFKPIYLDFYPKLYVNRNEKNKICSMAGFGLTGTFDTGFLGKEKSDNRKRAGSNIIYGIQDNLLICSSTDQKTSLEFIIAPGDSGGGLFIENKLAGIHSCVFGTDGASDSDYGDTSGHTRISDYIDWIQQTQEAIEKMMKE